MTHPDLRALDHVIEKIGLIITAADNIGDVYQGFIHALTQLVPIDRASISLFDEETGSITLKYLVGTPRTHTRRCRSNLPIDGSQYQQVLSSAVTSVRADIWVDVSFPEDSEFAEMGLRSNVTVPLRVGTRIVGVWNLYSNHPRAYDESHLAILDQVATLLGPAVENAALHQQIRVHMQELLVADGISRILASNAHIDQVYEEFALALKNLVPFDRIVVTVIDYETGRAGIKYKFGMATPGDSCGNDIPLKGSYTQELIDRGQTWIRRDIRQDGRCPKDQELLQAGLVSFIMVPLIFQGRIVGNLSLLSTKVGCYGPREQGILERLASQIAPIAENSLLHEKIQSSIRAFESLDVVAKIITSSHNIGEVFDNFALALKELVSFDRICINTLGKDGSSFMIKYISGEEVAGPHIGDVAPMENTQTHYAITTGHSLIRDDIARHPRFVTDQKYIDVGSRSSLMVPLVSNGRIIGTLILRSRHLKTYGAQQQALMERLATLIGPTIENETLQAQMQATEQELSVVDDIAHIVSSTLDIDDVFEKFAREIKKLVAFDRININLIEPATQSRVLKYVYGITIPGLAIGIRLPLTNTLAQKLIDTRQTLIVEDLGDTGVYSFDQVLIDAGLRSRIAVPFIFEGQCIATLNLYSRQTHAYGQREQTILERLASQISPSIRNSMLYEDVKVEQTRSTRAEARLNGILQVAVDAILAIDEEHRIIVYNDAAEKVFGYRPEEALGQSLDLVLPRSQIESHKKHLLDFADMVDYPRDMAEGRTVVGRHKDGHEVLIDVKISQLTDGAGKTFVANIRDVAERTKLEDRLLQLQETERLKGVADFTADESNKLLTLILEHTESAAMSLTPGDPVALDLNEIKRAAVAGNKLASQLAAARRYTAPRRVDDQSS